MKGQTRLLDELESALAQLKYLLERGKTENRTWTFYMVNAMEYVRASVETERRHSSK